MSGSEQVELAEGLTAVIPEGWEFCCEVDENLIGNSIIMRNTGSDASLELLNNYEIDSKKFIFNYRFKLMRQLVELGYSFKDPEPTNPDELVAISAKTRGVVYHAFLFTSPIVHISAVCQDIENLVDLRQIKESIQINQDLFGVSSEEIVGMKISDSWRY